MSRHLLTGTALSCALLAFSAAAAHAEHFSANFSGFQELGALNAETGAILSNGTATLDLDLDQNAHTLTFKLTFANLSTPVTQAHIHFGRNHVPGGVIVFFCTNLNNSPVSTQACPAGGGTVTGTLKAGEVVGPAGQNITVGDFDGLEDALTSNSAYGNIHTTKFPAGEIRGQIHRGDHDDDR
jgi:hypothetical protein